MVRVNAVIFDLDNVLFDERDYILAAYRNIAAFLSKRYRLSEDQVYQKLLDDLQKKTSMYPHLFDDVLTDLELDQAILPDILKIYTNTTTKLKLFSGVEQLLNALKRKKVLLGLVTNGNVETQRNKVHLLGLEKYFDTIVYAREIGKENEKPNPEAYRIALKTLRVTPEEAICIGDNPHTDFWGAKKLKIQTVRLLSGEFKDVRLAEDFEADLTVRTLAELKGIVEKSI